MTKERLQDLTMEALQELASRKDIPFYQHVERDSLVEQILEVVEEEKSERESSNNAAMRVKEKKFDIIKDEETVSVEPDEFELPKSYNETKISLLLRDPLWAYAYWDLKQSDIEMIEKRPVSHLTLRAFQIHTDEQGVKEKKKPFDIPVKVSDRSWYINLPKTGTRYFVELIMRGQLPDRILCASNIIESPEISISPTHDSSTDKSFYSILAISGLQEPGDFSEKGGIPRRIISLLDTQYLHLQG